LVDQVKVFKALADETRLRLMRLLARGALNVNEIIGILEMGQSRVSRHLRILSEADLVTSRREGTWIYYQWSTEEAESTLVGDTLLHLGAHERALSHYESDIQGLEAVVARRREQTRSYFDSLRDPHEFLEHRSLDGQFYRRVALELMPRQCTKVLDMGTGSGLLVPALLERAQSVVAVDSSATMLELARRTVGPESHRCDFRLGDLEHLPVADGEVDAVMACMVLHHLSDPARVLTEAHRVLSRGGVIVVVDLHRHSDESLRERMADLWLGFQPDDMSGWLRSASFQLVESGKAIPEPAGLDNTPGSDHTTAAQRVGQGEPEPLQLITFKGRKP
jgi:ArsR family transcriptional regulator